MNVFVTSDKLPMNKAMITYCMLLIITIYTMKNLNKMFDFFNC